MSAALRFIRLLALALWVGGSVFFVVTTAVAFKVLPDAHTAGLIVRSTLTALHIIGLGAAAAYTVATLVLLFTGRDQHPLRLAEIVLVVSMAALTAWSQYSVIPRMESDRLAVGGDIAKANPDDPRTHDFNHLHGLSTKLEGVVLFEGLILLALATLYGPAPYDRFS